MWEHGGGGHPSRARNQEPSPTVYIKVPNPPASYTACLVCCLHQHAECNTQRATSQIALGRASLFWFRVGAGDC